MSMDIASYVGIPYKDLGRTREALDCWGLVCQFYQDQFNIELPNYVTHTSEQATKLAAEVTECSQDGSWEKVNGEPKYGDVIIFRIMAHPVHIGVYLEDGYFLHTFPKRDSCIENLTSLTWSNRKDGVYRWKKNLL
jgi:cell wall-associated NlpC family hydrolase